MRKPDERNDRVAITVQKKLATFDQLAAITDGIRTALGGVGYTVHLSNRRKEVLVEIHEGGHLEAAALAIETATASVLKGENPLKYAVRKLPAAQSRD